MNAEATLRHEFVKFIPEILTERTVYISLEYATAVHKCCCGCGREVVTPLSPTDWRITYDGVSISLDPSIGNWSFPCKSHYWIRRNRIVWAEVWSSNEIHSNKQRNRRSKEIYYQTEKRLLPLWSVWRFFKKRNH
jgi:hypothetical protein